MSQSAPKVHKSFPAVYIIIAVAILGALVGYFTYYAKAPSAAAKARAEAGKANFERAVVVVKSELTAAVQGVGTSPDIVALLNQGNMRSPADRNHPAFVATGKVQDDGQTMISPADVGKAYREGKPITVTPPRDVQAVNPKINPLSITVKPGQGVVVLRLQS